MAFWHQHYPFSLAKINGAISFMIGDNDISLGVPSEYACPKIDPVTLLQSGSVSFVSIPKSLARTMPSSTDYQQLGQQIIQMILTDRGSQTLLSTIAEQVGRHFGAEFCLIFAGAKGNSVSEMGGWTAGKVAIPGPQMQARFFTAPLIEEALSTGEPVVASQATSTTTDWLWEILPVPSLVCLSTRLQAIANGLILLGRSSPHEWTNAELEGLKMVTDSVAIASSQIQFESQTHFNYRQKTLLQDLSVVIRNTSDLDQILMTTLTGTAQALEADRGFIFMLKYADPLYKTRHRPGLPKAKVTVPYQWSAESGAKENAQLDSRLTNYSFSLSECSFCQEALKLAPQPLAIANQETYTEIANPITPDVVNLMAMPSLLMIPFMGSNPNNDPSQAVVLGFLVLQNHAPRLWQLEELDLLNWVSAQTTTAIIHHQTLRQVQSLVEERTAQLQRSLEVQAKLYEKTRQQVDQLRKLNQLKDEFMATMSHELNTPMASMKMAIRMLRQPGLSPDRQARYLDILEQEWTRENNLIKDLLTLQQLESNQSTINPERLNLNEVIDEVAQGFSEKWSDRGLTLAIEYDLNENSHNGSPLTIYTDLDSLKRILVELLTNAGKYAEADTTIHFSARHSVSPEGNQVVFTLTNTGPIISPEEQQYIFEPFRRGQGVTEKAIQGTGLGLALVKCLVQHLNGTINVSSGPSDNEQTGVTSFTVTLPQYQSLNPKLN